MDSNSELVLYVIGDGNRGMEINGIKHLTNYVCKIFEDGGWETDRFVSRGEAYAHAICHHEDLPTIGLITLYTEKSGFGGMFAERFGYLSESSQATEFSDVDVWGMILYTEGYGFRSTTHQSDFCEYLLNHFGFGYFDLERNIDEDPKVCFQRNTNANIPLKPHTLASEWTDATSLDRCDIDAVYKAVERGRKRRKDYRMIDDS